MRRFALLALAVPLALAAPAPVPIAEPTAFYIADDVPVAEPTAAPELVRKGITDDASSFFDSVGSNVESGLSSFVQSGVLVFASGFPTGSAVEKTLGISDSDVKPKPTQVLNVPAYGNWTAQGWNVRVHGNVYKIPDVNQSRIDDLANVFLIDTSVSKLPEEGKMQARNVTRSIFIVQQGSENVTMNFVPNTAVKANASGGVFNANGGKQSIKLPYETTPEGDFDVFVKLANTTKTGGNLQPGNETLEIQSLNMYTEGANSGNATAYLVPPVGTTIVSDIDDILRVTKIYEPKEGLLNTFARPFTPWMSMPSIYANWSSSLSDFHFHYLTTTPEQITRNYMDFIYKTYPLGSFDTRPLNFSDVSAVLSIRKFLLDKVFETFPKRKFILVADTSNSDVMKDYPKLYHEHPTQVSCILLRNTSSTDSGDKFPYDTSGFKGIPQDRYMFFNVPDDLLHLDIANGQCYNKTIMQNVTFSTQGLPLGLSKDSAGGTTAPRLVTAMTGLLLAVVLAAW